MFLMDYSTDAWPLNSSHLPSRTTLSQEEELGFSSCFFFYLRTIFAHTGIRNLVIILLNK